jgi:hypothetical protein
MLTMQTKSVSSRAELLNSCATHSRRLCLFGCMATLAGIGALIACATISGSTQRCIALWDDKPVYVLDLGKLRVAYGCAFGAGALLMAAGVGAVSHGRKQHMRKAQILGAICLAAAALAIVYGTALCHMQSRATDTRVYSGMRDADYHALGLTIRTRPSGYALTGWKIAGGVLVGGGLLMSAAGVTGHYVARRTIQPADRATEIG